MNRAFVSPHPRLAAAPTAAADRRSADSVRVVLLTRTGEIALGLERLPGLAPVVRLPGLRAARALDSREALRRRLREEAGLEAGDLIVISRYGIPTGEQGNAAILLAPAARRRRMRGVAYVPVRGLSLWLRQRRAEGWRVDLMVRVGLRLAERHFARWGRVRLREVLAQLRGRHGGSPAAAREWPRPRLARVR